MTWGKKGPKLKPRVVPISNWFLLVTLFFIVSVLNNLALGYNISIPLHIIFRSGGLIINMLLGTLFLKKRYSVGQITGILLVTVGVICATLNYDNIASDNNDQTDFSVGIILLVIAMFLSAGMGLFQEVLYQKYGKQWREGLFYTHFLALPLFIFFYKDLFHQAVLYNSSPLQPLAVILEQIPILNAFRESIPFIGFKVRKLWAFLIMNVITQYVCISGVNRMTSISK
ncbi:UAA transporter [Backusella circina FSU 941]|nr:UAA transporter [Backusella circina FSU 941]